MSADRAIIVIVVQLYSTSRWDYDLILHRTRIAGSNSTAHQYKRTPCSSFRANTIPRDTFDAHKRTAGIIAIVVYLYIRHIRVRLLLITTSFIIVLQTRITASNASSAHQYKRTALWWCRRGNMHDARRSTNSMNIINAKANIAIIIVDYSVFARHISSVWL